MRASAFSIAINPRDNVSDRIRLRKDKSALLLSIPGLRLQNAVAAVEPRLQLSDRGFPILTAFPVDYRQRCTEISL
jgi:hypothetical protein